MDRHEIRELIESHTIIDDMSAEEFDSWDSHIGKRDDDITEEE